MSKRLDRDYFTAEFERLYDIRNDGSRDGIIEEAIMERDRLAGQLTHTTTALKRISRAHASAEHLQSVADEALAALVSGGETPR